MEDNNIYVRITQFLFNKDIMRNDGIIGKVRARHMRGTLLKLIDLYTPSREYTSMYRFFMDFINFYSELDRGFLIGENKKLKESLKVYTSTGCDNSNTTYYTIKINIHDGWEHKIDLKEAKINFNNTDKGLVDFSYSYGKDRKTITGVYNDNEEDVWTPIGLGLTHVLKLIVKTLDCVKPQYAKNPYTLLKLEMGSFYMSETKEKDLKDSINVKINEISIESIAPFRKKMLFPVKGVITLPEQCKTYLFDASIYAYYSDFVEPNDDNKLNQTIHSVLNREIVFNFKNFNGWLFDIVYDQAVSMSGVDLRND